MPALFKAELSVQTPEVWRHGRLGRWGAPESRLQALGGVGVGSEPELLPGGLLVLIQVCFAAILSKILF